MNSLNAILNSQPTAELEPLVDNQVAQTDEVDMGLTYSELNSFGKLRKRFCCGPYSMYGRLSDSWFNHDLNEGQSSTVQQSPQIIAEKVKHFFK